MKKRIISALVALGMVIGIGVPSTALASRSWLGVTYDAKEPYKFYPYVHGQGSAVGTPSSSGPLQVHVHRYEGGTWYVAGSGSWTLTAGTSYNKTFTVAGNCKAGAYTYRTAVRFNNGAWDYSAGRSIAC